MCLILFAHQIAPSVPLVVAANRDEFHGRPAAPAARWPDAPGVLAGRDLQEGGTWLGISASGRFAAVTNFSGQPPEDAPRSRGALVADFLRSNVSGAEYLHAIAPHKSEYRGFNLLINDGQQMYCFSNRIDRDPAAADITPLAPGIYGLSNDLLDCGWYKVRMGKALLQNAIAPLTADSCGADASLSTAQSVLARMQDVLTDSTKAADDELPNRGRDIELERRHSSCFITNETYGTRASSMLIARNGQMTFVEQSWAPDGGAAERATETLAWPDTPA